MIKERKNLINVFKKIIELGNTRYGIAYWLCLKHGKYEKYLGMACPVCKACTHFWIEKEEGWFYCTRCGRQRIEAKAEQASLF